MCMRTAQTSRKPAGISQCPHTQSSKRAAKTRQRIAKSPVLDTACQSTHRSQMRLVIRVNDGHG